MADRKGKAPADCVEADDHTIVIDNSIETNTKSITEKVVASAKGLAQSTFAAPTNKELSAHAIAAAASAGKGQLSYAYESPTWEGSSRPTHQDATSLSLGQEAPFRTHEDKHIANAEAEFTSFLDGVVPFSCTTVIRHSDGLTDQFRNHETCKPFECRHDEPQIGFVTVKEQQLHDGEAVSAILSQTANVLVEAPGIYKEFDEDEPVTWIFNPGQRAQWHERLCTDFPQLHLHTAVDNHNPLNLMPLIETTGESRESLVAQWENVLNRYTDDVWGDLLPLVKKARGEVAAFRQDPVEAVSLHPKALRRLGLVLGHLSN